MSAVLGSKGQVVIAKKYRDQLGLKPGWVAIQKLVGEKVEISFVPPEHNRSLKGALKSKIAPSDAPPDALNRADIWANAAKHKFEPAEE